MTRELTCIGCPMGCELTVGIENGEAVSVTGNTCKIGENYAKTEVSAPVRTVTTTMSAQSGKPVPVRTAGEIPKGKIFEVVQAVKNARVKLPVNVGDVLIEDAAGTGVAVIATKSVGS